MIEIAALVPHAGAMVLLESVERWDAAGIVCRTRTHLAVDNPLRRDGRLGVCCGIEYGLQAAALHGALCAGGLVQAAGYVASLRNVRFEVERIDDPALGELRVEARLAAQERFGMIYDFGLSVGGTMLVSGRASVALPR